jgi:peroxiredoxin Q/BCP
MQKVCPLKENDSAPEFSTTDSAGNPISQKKLLGKKYLLYFYPRDNTPGCTAQACGFKNHYDFFKDKNIEIFGVSGDSAKSHQKFIEKFQLPFPLLLDEEHEIAKAFGVWGEKKFMGRTFEGIHRMTFLINESGMIERSFIKVKAKSHPEELVKEL